MSFESGTAPRRLLQTHGAFINAVLAPNIKQKRHYGVGDTLKTKDNSGKPAQDNHAKRLNVNMEFVSNDEVFDAREGEILVNSLTESGFPAHRRGALFSSLNGFRVQDGGSREPHEAVLQNSDLRFVGLCQNSFVSSNTALAEQGMAVQVSGIKTIINDSEETINIGDKLMVDTMRRVPSKVRKGIPNEKVRLVLRKVPQGFVPQTAMKEALKKIKEIRKTNKTRYGTDKVTLTAAGSANSVTDDVIENIAALVITEFRKAGHWVVGVAENSARHGEQLDVLLTKPSFL